MKIKEFIDAVQNINIETDVANLISVKKYITSASKVKLANAVIDLSAEYDRGFVKFNSYKRHLAFIFAAIEAHTNIKFADKWEDKIQEYDALCENGLIDVVISTFKTDYDVSREVLDMMCADMLAENSLEISIAKLAQSASENLDVFVGALADKLGELDIEKIIPEGLDLDKLQGLLNNFK